ncbi:MAG: lactonase family protein [Thermoguttaceae bacterium]|nr:lactonase family protein [Thermoguttaceae bacterium]
MKSTFRTLLRATGAFVVACAFVLSAFAAETNDYWIYFGTSTGPTTPEQDEAGIPRSEGIYVGKFDATTGKISDVRLALKAVSSGYIATLPEKDLLYFVGGVSPKDGWANACACKVDPKTGDLEFINSVPTTGDGVCHTSVRADGKFLNAANYSSGDFSVLSLNSDGSVGKVTAKYRRDGSGPLKRRQNHPYGHSSYFVENDGVCRVFMSDLGSDKIYIAQLDEETGELTEDPAIPYLATPAGAGPRHLSFITDDSGKLFVFSINELDSTLSAFRVDFAAGKSERLGTWTTIEDEYRKGLTDEETLVDGKEYLYGNKTAGIEALTLPNGKTIVYATNRGQNTIVAFDATGLIAGTSTEFPLLQRISTNGSFPRYMTLDPTNRYVIVSNKKSGTVFVYSIDSESGLLTLTNEEPTRVAWVIAGGFIPQAK